MDLSVNYMGLGLKSPFIASSSGFTVREENLKALEEAGIGAVVLKSLFEEQIAGEADFLNRQSAEHPESADFLHHYLTQYSVGKYLDTIRMAKKTVSVPVIASINCYDAGSWLSFAEEIESAGADALEINIYSLPLSLEAESNAVEREYIDVIRSVAGAVKIPVAVKLADTFTTLPQFVYTLKLCGAKGIVLFNRFYQPDIDLENMAVTAAAPWSPEGSYLNGLRWTALLSSLVKGVDFSATTGIHKPEEAVKLLLAGATTVQLCSVLYKKGAGIVKEFRAGLESFLQEKGFDSVAEISGLLNYSRVGRPEQFERVQFLKTFGDK